MALAITGGTTAALVVGTMQVRSGHLTIGELLLVMAYIAQFYDPLRTISSKIPEMESWRASTERALALLDEVPDVVDRPGAVSLSQTTGAVAFRNVSFEYRRGNPVLHDICFEVGPGKRVGIVGPSGSGKTTLVNLLRYRPFQLAGQRRRKTQIPRLTFPALVKVRGALLARDDNSRTS